MNFEYDPMLPSRTECSLRKNSTYTAAGKTGASVEMEASGGEVADAGSAAPDAWYAYASFASSHSSLTAASVFRRLFNSRCSHSSKVSDNLHTPLTALVKFQVIEVFPFIGLLQSFRQAFARLPLWLWDCGLKSHAVVYLITNKEDVIFPMIFKDKMGVQRKWVYVQNNKMLHYHMRKRKRTNWHVCI